MRIMVLLIAAGGVVALGFLLAFIWAVRTGQFDDTLTPAVRVLVDDVGQPARSAQQKGSSHDHRAR